MILILKFYFSSILGNVNLRDNQLALKRAHVDVKCFTSMLSAMLFDRLLQS